MDYRRMPIEIESPEQFGYGNIDCNLTESSVSDIPLHELCLPDKNVLLGYGDHLGKPELRELIARGNGVTSDQVLITAGAAAALFIINTSILSKGDHAVILKPNYSTNIETPRMIGASIDFIELVFEEKYQLNRKRLNHLLKPVTKLISITKPHNPTGTIISNEVIQEILLHSEKTGAFILVDETYRGLSFIPEQALAATIHPRIISVGSLSKAYGLPGLRIGWIICKNKRLMEKFLAAKEQIFICNSVLDEETGYLFLKEKDQFMKNIQKSVGGNFSQLKKWMSNQKLLEWVEPQGGVIAFPRVKSDAGVNIEKFYQVLNTKYKTFVGPGHWFEMDRRNMRIGYAWPDKEQLIRGLLNIGHSLQESLE